jgi:hypothetical protein
MFDESIVPYDFENYIKSYLASSVPDAVTQQSSTSSTSLLRGKRL